MRKRSDGHAEVRVHCGLESMWVSLRGVAPAWRGAGEDVGTLLSYRGAQQ
jgi:hypothetical protein